MTILEKDIDLWQATVETHEEQLRRCAPADEGRYKDLLDAALGVLEALQAYAETVQA